MIIEKSNYFLGNPEWLDYYFWLPWHCSLREFLHNHPYIAWGPFPDIQKLVSATFQCEQYHAESLKSKSMRFNFTNVDETYDCSCSFSLSFDASFFSCKKPF